MDCKYPHWYQGDDNMEPGCDDYMAKDVCCDEPMAYKMYDFHRESFKDRILCLLGDEVLFSVDARFWKRAAQFINYKKPLGAGRGAFARNFRRCRSGHGCRRMSPRPRQ